MLYLIVYPHAHVCLISYFSGGVGQRPGGERPSPAGRLIHTHKNVGVPRYPQGRWHVGCRAPSLVRVRAELITILNFFSVLQFRFQDEMIDTWGGALWERLIGLSQPACLVLLANIMANINTLNSEL